MPAEQQGNYLSRGGAGPAVKNYSVFDSAGVQYGIQPGLDALLAQLDGLAAGAYTLYAIDRADNPPVATAIGTATVAASSPKVTLAFT